MAEQDYKRNYKIKFLFLFCNVCFFSRSTLFPHQNYSPHDHPFHVMIRPHEAEGSLTSSAVIEPKYQIMQHVTLSFYIY